MSDATFDRLLDQLATIPFEGRFSYHFYNEPLLRRDLERFIAEAKRRLPQSVQTLFTNGDLLTATRYESLLAAGVDKFIVTRHDDDMIPERPQQVLLKGSELQLSNRGGLMFEIPEPLKLPCYSPSEMLIVTVTGDVVLCYEDAERRYVLGNIMDSTLKEIWEQDLLQQRRTMLAEGKRAATTPMCARCNNLDAAIARR